MCWCSFVLEGKMPSQVAQLNLPSSCSTVAAAAAAALFARFWAALPFFGACVESVASDSESAPGLFVPRRCEGGS